MNNQIKLHNYVHLAILSTSLLLIVKFITTALHELGHCLGGWLVGLKPVGIYVAVLGGGKVYIPGTRSFWQGLIMTSSGPAVDIILGLIVLLIIFPRAKKWGFKLFWLFYGTIAILMFWGYMVIGGFLGSGDFANLARMMAVSRYLFGIIGLIGLIGFAYLISRYAFKTFDPYFPLHSAWNKFLVFFLFVGLPMIVYVVGGYLIYPGGSINELLLVSFLAIIISGLLSIFRFQPGTSFQRLPEWPTFAGIFILTVVIFVWLMVFGLTEEHARGLLWRTPEETSVSACNISISIEKDFNARIDFLMRPTTRYLFWEKMKHQPPNWQIYTSFIETNLPILLGISDYKIIEKVDDVISPFYLRENDKGARRITLDISLDTVVQKIDENTYAFEITDFWCVKGGYLEKLQVNLNEGIRFSDYEFIPMHAKNPDRYDEHEIIWENRDSNAPKIVRLIIINEG
ncbi:MAG TPA: hypothetical protein ENN22_14910 [bacterium]|nr:hypothetical protein [bacterium]